MYEKLVGYEMKHETTRVPLEPNTKLGTWVLDQRYKYNKNKFSLKADCIIDSRESVLFGRQRKKGSIHARQNKYIRTIGNE